jgi:hypothetical protein
VEADGVRRFVITRHDIRRPRAEAAVLREGRAPQRVDAFDERDVDRAGPDVGASPEGGTCDAVVRVRREDELDSAVGAWLRCPDRSQARQGRGEKCNENDPFFQRARTLTTGHSRPVTAVSIRCDE